MIAVTRMDGKAIFLNADWIQTVESTPDTMITLTTGTKVIVRESVDEIIKAYKKYKRDITKLKVLGRTGT